jgi:hypothetical protein
MGSKVTGPVHIAITTMLAIIVSLVGYQWLFQQETTDEKMDLLRTEIGLLRTDVKELRQTDIKELRQELKATRGVMGAATGVNLLQEQSIDYLRVGQAEIKGDLKSHIERHAP